MPYCKGWWIPDGHRTLQLKSESIMLIPVVSAVAVVVRLSDCETTSVTLSGVFLSSRLLAPPLLFCCLR